MTPTLILAVLATHFVGDFVFQTNWQATNKWNNLMALYWHVVVYSLCFVWLGMWFYWVTFLCHLATDFVTSKFTHKLSVEARENGNWHNFFAVVGFDQFLHQAQLLITLWLLSR